MEGGSVARASAAKVSMRMLIQSICRVAMGAESGGRVTELTIRMTIAPMLMTS